MDESEKGKIHQYLDENQEGNLAGYKTWYLAKFGTETGIKKGIFDYGRLHWRRKKRIEARIMSAKIPTSDHKPNTSTASPQSSTVPPLKKYHPLLDYLMEHEARIRELIEFPSGPQKELYEAFNVKIENPVKVTMRIEQSTAEQIKQVSKQLGVSQNRFLNVAILAMIKQHCE